MGMILKDALMHIKINSLPFDKLGGFVALVIDFWYKLGYYGTDTLDCKVIDACDAEVERYNYVDENYLDNDDANDSSYKRRLEKKKERGQVVLDVFEDFVKNYRS